MTLSKRSWRGPDKRILRSQTDPARAEIDRLVYELYGLTEAEIKVVEGKGSVGS